MEAILIFFTNIRFRLRRDEVFRAVDDHIGLRCAIIVLLLTAVLFTLPGCMANAQCGTGITAGSTLLVGVGSYGTSCTRTYYPYWSYGGYAPGFGWTVYGVQLCNTVNPRGMGCY